MSTPRYSPAWVYAHAMVYLIHLADERYWGIGTAEFATHYLGIYFTNPAWWMVNVPSLVLFALATVLLARGWWPQWVVLALSVHLALHGLGRIPTSLWTGEVAPGVVTGVLLCTPLAAATWWRGLTAFDRRDQLRSALVGIASFQPLWHFALLPFPFLPTGPASG